MLTTIRRGLLTLGNIYGKLTIFATMITVIACSSSNFSGSGKKANSADSTNGKNGIDSPDKSDKFDNLNSRKSDGSPSSTGTSGNKEFACESSTGKTQVTLLTPSVSNGVKGNYIEFELRLTDCDNQIRNFEANKILFDIDAQTDAAGRNQALTFTIEANGESINGKLLEIKGEDLFGNQGSKYFHNRSDEEISFATKVSSARLRIELMGLTANDYQDGGGNSKNDNEVTLPIYLRFGKATPVRADVIFK